MFAPDPRHHRRFQAGLPLIGLSEFGQPSLMVLDGRNSPHDRGGPATGVPAFCNTAHQWIALTTGLAVTN